MRLGARQLFIYWRMPAAARDDALLALQRLQRELASRHAALIPALFIRAEPTAAEATLMEVYATDAGTAPEGVGTDLQSDIICAGDAATAAWRTGPRHVEAFDSVG